MATKLKNLKITSVDLVEQGANPDAHIKLYKSKDGQGEKVSEKNTLLDRLMQRLAAMVADYLKEKENADDKAKQEEGAETQTAEKEQRQDTEEPISLDTAKLTAREKRFLAELAEKYGQKPKETAQVAKAKAELIQVEKQLQRAKTMAIAKEYAILGKSADNLCDTLLELAERTPHGYRAFLDALDEEKLLIEKSGVFSEIGKRGEKDSGAGGWGKIMAAADRLQKENPTLTRAGAIQKACEDYPQLVEDYEENL